MRKAAVRAMMTRAAGGARAFDRSSDLVNQVSMTAAEYLRNRRDMSVVAQRKAKAARRRVSAWSAVSVAALAVGTVGVTEIVQVGATGGSVAAAIVVIALLVWGLVGLARAVADLRVRNRVVRALPPPQPARPAVVAAVRPEMDRLDGYSDGLRHLVAMIGVSRDDPSVLSLRGDILTAADAAEDRLRQQAAEFSGLARARSSAPSDARPRLAATAEVLLGQISAGVAAYGDLVTAASETVAASRELAAGAPAPQSDLSDRTDQLKALAVGMRELTGG